MKNSCGRVLVCSLLVLCLLRDSSSFQRSCVPSISALRASTEEDVSASISSGSESFKAPSFEIDRRRNFAIISHPDAGKTTLTEKLLLFGGAIQDAGAVKARGDQRKVTSDWMEIEKARCVRSSINDFHKRARLGVGLGSG